MRLSLPHFSSIPLLGMTIFLMIVIALPNFLTGQQVIVKYRGEQKPAPRYTQDGRLIDFPEQIIMATLKATPKASVWSHDSIMFMREGVFAEGFRLYAPGHWEYRNKITKKSLIHKLYYSEDEFLETSLELTLNDNCAEWEIEAYMTKTVLGLVCSKAIRRCGQTDQIAYFTRSIPIVDGPIFIASLPGLVLDFDDGIYHYTAQHFSANENEISPPQKVTLINDDRYHHTDTRVILKKPIVKVNSWINLSKHYLIH